MNSDKTENQIPFCSHLSLQTSLWPSTHPFLLQSIPTCVQSLMSSPNYSVTLDPGHCSPPRSPTSQPADCRGLKVQAGSAGNGEGRGASRRNHNSAMAGGAGSGKTPGRKDARGGDKAGGYLRASGDTTPVVAMATRHLGALEALAAALRALA